MIGPEAVAALKAAFRVADLEPETIRLYAAKLDEIDEKLLQKTIHVAIDRCKFFPSIAELKEIAAEIAGGGIGHLGPDEAWALVAGLTEEDSVVWTDEIAAAYGIAVSVLPDRVGARMAFLAAYKRKLLTAPLTPRWWASLGESVTGRAAAISDAVERQRLSPQAVPALLPPQYRGTPWGYEAPPARERDEEPAWVRGDES